MAAARFTGEFMSPLRMIWTEDDASPGSTTNDSPAVTLMAAILVGTTLATTGARVYFLYWATLELFAWTIG